MLEKVTFDALPVSRRENPNKKFAQKTLEDFVDLDCDAARITGWPVSNRTASALVGTMRTVIKEQAMSSLVRAHSDGEHVYLSRRR